MVLHENAQIIYIFDIAIEWMLTELFVQVSVLR
jgi:hypothetical protein